MSDHNEFGMVSHRTRDPFVAFLYELMRDEVPVGTVQRIVEGSRFNDDVSEWVLSNPFLAEYAEYLVRRMTTRSRP